MDSFWTELTASDIVELIGNVLTPLTIVIVSTVFTLWFRQRDSHNRKLTEIARKRVELWDEIAGPLNDMYAYMLFVGQWKDLSATEIVARKRETDKVVYAYRPFFSDTFFKAYLTFINEVFKHNNKWGTDAILRTTNIRPTDDGTPNERFTSEDNTQSIHMSYFKLFAVSAEEFDLVVSTNVMTPVTPKSRAQVEGIPNNTAK